MDFFIGLQLSRQFTSSHISSVISTFSSSFVFLQCNQQSVSICSPSFSQLCSSLLNFLLYINIEFRLTDYSTWKKKRRDLRSANRICWRSLGGLWKCARVSVLSKDAANTAVESTFAGRVLVAGRDKNYSTMPELFSRGRPTRCACEVRVQMYYLII